MPENIFFLSITVPKSELVVLIVVVLLPDGGGGIPEVDSVI